MQAQERPPVQTEDIRATRPYLLARSPLKTLAWRTASAAVLVAIDIAGLVIGVFAALAVRALIRGPEPILWNLLWNLETNWLPFLILLLLLVFWRNRLYGPRELREGAGRIAQSVFLVALFSLAFAIGTGQHIYTLGLYAASALFVAILISVFRWSYENVTGSVMRSLGVQRKVLLVGDSAQVEQLKRTLGAARGGIDYDFTGTVTAGPALRAELERQKLDELIVADSGLDEPELLAIVEEAHRYGVKVRVAPRTTELLIERGEYVPGQGVPLFELRAPIFAGTDWALKRAFDLLVSAAIVVVGSPLWLLIALLVKLDSRGPVFYADRRVGLGEQEFDMLKFRTMVEGAARAQPALEDANEATGALFKIRDDPRVTRVGRWLRRYSLDELPNVVNVLRGQMSLVGPRPLPVRDYAKLEAWHRKRSNVLPGMTGLWQIAGRSNLPFDDLVRLDFYYLENWSLWLDITILVRTVPAVASRRGAY